MSCSFSVFSCTLLGGSTLDPSKYESDAVGRTGFERCRRTLVERCRWAAASEPRQAMLAKPCCLDSTAAGPAPLPRGVQADALVKSTLGAARAEDASRESKDIDGEPDAEGDEGDERADSEDLEPRDPPRARGDRRLES